MFRLLNKRPRGILSMLKTRIAKITQEPGTMAMSTHTGSTEEQSKGFRPSKYTNARGECIIFKNQYQSASRIPGYVYVEAGNVYISKHCRRLTKESGRMVYVVYQKSWNKRARHEGLYIPKDILEQVESDYELFRKRGSESLWRKLHRGYPNMPHDDKCEVHRIISSQNSDPAGKSAQKSLGIVIYSYYRDSHIPFKFLIGKASLNKEAISKLHERIKKTIEFWRGRVSPHDSFEHKTQADLSTTKPSETTKD